MLLGQCRKWKGSGPKRKCVIKDDAVMYVPILKTLQVQLQNQLVLSEVCI